MTTVQIEPGQVWVAASDDAIADQIVIEGPTVNVDDLWAARSPLGVLCWVIADELRRNFRLLESRAAQPSQSSEATTDR